MEKELLDGALSVEGSGTDAESPAVETISKPEPPPVSPITSVYPELLAIPPSTAPIPKKESQPYYRITQDDLMWVGDITVPGSDPTKPIVKTYFMPGDNIYVQLMDGTVRWGIRLGSDVNPLIRLREGMIITRPFNKFTLYSMDAAGVGNLSAAIAGSEFQRSRFELLISTGPLVTLHTDRLYGVGPGNLGRIDCVATTTPRLFNQDYQPLQFGVTLEALTLGSEGGILYLRNSDQFNTLILKMVGFGGIRGEDVWRLYPGEAHTLLVDGRIADFNDESGLFVYVASGTCKYDWWFSRRSSEPPSVITSTPPY